MVPNNALYPIGKFASLHYRLKYENILTRNKAHIKFLLSNSGSIILKAFSKTPY